MLYEVVIDIRCRLYTIKDKDVTERQHSAAADIEVLTVWSAFTCSRRRATWSITFRRQMRGPES